MRVRFWGVRGAIAATAGGAQGVGGNTICVEVRDASQNLVVLDAGIGLYWLGRSLLTGPHGRGKGELTMLLSHTHWDHIQGFPFFVPAFIPGNTIHLWGGGVEASDVLENVLEGQMNPIYNPLVSLTNMGASIEFGDLNEHERLEVGELAITHATYKNGPHEIVGYRIEEDGHSLCYLSEVEHPYGGLTPEVLQLAQGADLLIHESYYTDEELESGGRSLLGIAGPAPAGHTSFGRATDLALAAGVKRLFYFYYHPDHCDQTIAQAVERERKRVSDAGSGLVVDAAREGSEFEV